MSDDPRFQNDDPELVGTGSMSPLPGDILQGRSFLTPSFDGFKLRIARVYQGNNAEQTVKITTKNDAGETGEVELSIEQAMKVLLWLPEVVRDAARGYSFEPERRFP